MLWFTAALARIVGAVGVAVGILALVDARFPRPLLDSRVDGALLLLGGVLALAVGHHLHELLGRRRQLRAVRDQLDFLQQVGPDRTFWPDGI